MLIGLLGGYSGLMVILCGNDGFFDDLLFLILSNIKHITILCIHRPVFKGW